MIDMSILLVNNFLISKLEINRKITFRLVISKGKQF
jgi:hypothetical protein